MRENNNLWTKCRLSLENSIEDAIKIIDISGLQIALIVDKEGVLLGTVTDGDIRRALLKGFTLDTLVGEIMYSTPLVVTPHISANQVIHLMKVNKVHKVPIVDERHRVVGMHLWEQIDLNTEPCIEAPFVIMAGGLGSRMKHHTQKCPKPMLKVAGKPMLEHIIERARDEGFRNFIISINYLGEIIKTYFGTGKRWGVKIEYLEEQKPLGTAGALAQLKRTKYTSFLITNGDVISDIRYRELLNFHKENNACATMAIRQFEWQNPFGVVEIEGLNILGFVEKPIVRSQINAGVYVLSNSAIDLLNEGEVCDMPALFSKVMSEDMKAIVFPMHETWADIGRPEDLLKANEDL
jgi:dTDP-glucose pyrophosphorylase